MALDVWTGTRRWLAAIPRGYSQVFFARSSWVGLLFVAATATEPLTFLSGLVAVTTAMAVAWMLRLDRDLTGSGYFAYNALLVGVGIGHLYGWRWTVLPITVLAAATSVLLTCAARGWLTRNFFLPPLSLPFLVVFWLLYRSAPDLGLFLATSAAAEAQPGSPVLGFLADYARCLGSVLFVPSIGAGALVAVGLLLSSRIAWLLTFSAFALVSVANRLLPSPLPSPVFVATAANAMLLAVAVGGVWFVPSRWSVLWSWAAVPACLLVTVGMYKPLGALGLPVLFLPFNLLAVAVLFAARERGSDGKPKAVDFVPGTPDENLHYFLNQRARSSLCYGMRFHLPFRGRWMCSQDVDGEHTHQGPWRHAFDFQVVDENGSLFAGAPDELLSYHCYKLPVLAAAPGLVVKIEDDVPDNPIGEMNLVRNWGNFVILQHAPGLFSLLAHLSPRSIKVREGQQVAQGDVLGLCGNSGRSPTPHIHFHLQKAPYPGAETLAVSFGDVVMVASIGERLEPSHAPRKGDVCRNLEPSVDLARRICPRWGDVWRMHWRDRTEQVRVDLDVLGQTRLRSGEAAGLSCTRTSDLHILHEVTGSPRSVLSLLRAALPRLPLEENPSLVWLDYVPARGALGMSRLGRVANWFVPRPGVAMSYAMRREGASLIVLGASLRRDGRGSPLLCTRIAIGPDGAPASIALRYGNREEHAWRVPSEASFPIESGATLSEAEPTDARRADESIGQQRQLN
jgi:murein DD-endopeptidase MepM/ murein hydrolase activator NlpD/urea transporter